MFKNTLIFILIILSSVQAYILYSNKDQNWLDQSIDQISQDVKSIIKPSVDAEETQSVASTTLSSVSVEEQTKLSETKNTPSQTITHTTTTSVAFKHLQSNLNCDSTNNIVNQSICSDASLMDQDKRLNFVLKKWAKSTKTHEFKIDTQEVWISKRHKTCNDLTKLKSCIQSMTESRIQAVTGQL